MAIASNVQTTNNFLVNPQLNFKEIVKVVPQKYIVFQCEDDQPMGEIRISVLPFKNLQIPPLCFELMCTNKQNYKVSHAKGLLHKSNQATLIRIYIKNIDNLQNCLSDKFRIRILDTKYLQQVIPPIKLKILIQKHKPMPKFEQISTNLTNTVSRTASVYTNPSIYTNLSHLSSTAASDIRSVMYFSRLLANQNKKISPTEQKEHNLNDLKQQFDLSNHKLNGKQKQLKAAQSNLLKNKTKQKVCLISLFVLFLLCILLGFLIKRLINSDLKTHFTTQINNQLFK